MSLYIGEDLVSGVVVGVEGAVDLQDKTVNPTESQQVVTYDAGFDGLSSVTVGAISSTYVGSGVTKQSAKTVTPTASSQTAVAAGRYTTGTVTVAAVPTETGSFSANGNYTPSSGKWYSSVTVAIPEYDGSYD